MNRSCYRESYKEKKKKKEIIEEGKYLLNSNGCDVESYEKLIIDIDILKQKCDDTFGPMFRGTSNISEKGNIINDNLCSQLREKQNDVIELSKEIIGRKSTARGIKRNTKRNTKRKLKRIKRQKNRTKKN